MKEDNIEESSCCIHHTNEHKKGDLEDLNLKRKAQEEKDDITLTPAQKNEPGKRKSFF